MSEPLEAAWQPDEFNPYRRFLGLYVPHVVAECPDLTPGAKLCYGRLLTYAGANGVAWPSLTALAKALGVSERTVQNYLKELRVQGFIRIYDQRHNHRSSYYRFLKHSSLDPDKALPPRPEPDPVSESELPSEDDQDEAHEINFVRGAHAINFVGAHEISFVSSLKNSERRIQAEGEPSAKAPPARKLGPAVLDRVSDPEAAPGRPGSALRSRERAAARPSPPSPGGPVPKTFSSERAVPREEESALDENADVPEKTAAERLKDASEHTERLRQGLLVKRGEAFQASASKRALAGNLKSDGMSGAPAGIRASAKECQRVWFAEFEKAFPGLTIADFGAKENAQLKNLLEKYGGSIVADALRYVVREWASIRKRYFKGKLGPNPTVGWILACHEQVVTESQVWAKHAPVLQEWAEWWKKNPNNPYPPSDLKSRYREAEKELSWMDGG